MANKIIVDNREVEFTEERNLLEVIRRAGIDIPTFCYHSELSIYGACRMCLVELGGPGGKVVASCSTPPEDGMVVATNTERLRRLRRTNLELLLANHDRECTTCEKSGSCRLEGLARRFNITGIRFTGSTKKKNLDESSPSLVRNPNKCILCGDCVRVCEEIQGVGVLGFIGRGAKTVVGPAFDKPLGEVECINCGQCAAVCPTGAIVVKSEVDKAWSAIHDSNRLTVVQIAPAVRVALGEEFGEDPGEINTGVIAAALRRVGFDKIFDTCFAADLTAVEETREFIGRLKKKEHLPQFTSCCPGWVKFAEQFYPEFLNNLSSCRSPQQMFGSVIKKYYAAQWGYDREDVFVVSIMPCIAKKFEAGRPEFKTDGVPDVDLVLSTQEIARMIKEAGVVWSELEPEALDSPLGLATGGGVIFGTSGGVAEAALRCAYRELSGVPLSGPLEFAAVRGLDGVKKAEVDVEGVKIKLAVVSGLLNARRLLTKVKAGEENFDLVEVMACPGGCIGGGGQPVPNNTAAREKRSQGLYRADRTMQLRRSTDNPAVESTYSSFLTGEAERHQALHTKYENRRRLAGEEISLLEAKQEALDVAVCVGTSCYQRGSYDTLHRLLQLIDKAGISDRVKVRATFCLERCGRGPSVRVNGTRFTGVKPDKVEDFFEQEIASRL